MEVASPAGPGRRSPPASWSGGLGNCQGQTGRKNVASSFLALESAWKIQDQCQSCRKFQHGQLDT